MSTQIDSNKTFPIVVERHASGVGWIVTADTPEQARDLYNRMLELFDGEAGYTPPRESAQPKEAIVKPSSKVAQSIAIRQKLMAKSAKENVK